MTDPWNPWAPPVPATPHRRDNAVVALAVAITVLLAAGVVALAGRAIAHQVAQDDAADTALDDALSRTPDTASISPGPDGTKRYDSPAPESDKHGFHVTLPPRWEGSYVGARVSGEFTDSALSGPGGFVFVFRLDLGMPLDPDSFSRGFIRGLEAGDPPVTVTTGWTDMTFAGDENGFYVEGTMRDEPDRLVLRVMFFEHGGEMFRVQFVSRSELWKQTLPDMQGILDSWRWG